MKLRLRLAERGSKKATSIYKSKKKKKEDIPFHNKNPYLLILSFSHSQIVTKLKKKNTPKKTKKKKDENKVKRKKKVTFFLVPFQL